MIVTSENFTPQKPTGFIVLEGGNGVGKSTLQAELNSWIQSEGFRTRTSFEPGATPLGASLRSILLGEQYLDRMPKTELFLFCADRAEHVDKIIRPALADGEIVILDRYFYSTIAFQGFGRNLGYDFTEQVCLQAVAGLLPDIVLLLEMDAKEALKRKESQSAIDSFEDEAIEFHTSLQRGFLEIAQHRPEPFAILDAGRDIEEVFSEAKKILRPLLNALHP